jgi:hypothetical protein
MLAHAHQLCQARPSGKKWHTYAHIVTFRLGDVFVFNDGLTLQCHRVSQKRPWNYPRPLL